MSHSLPFKRRLSSGMFLLLPTAGMLPVHAQVAATEASPVPAVRAQEVQDAGKESAQDEPTTVIVSATRRREPVREIPMQVDTIQAERLQRSGAASLRDYMEAQPGITVNSKGSSGQGDISIRGMTTGTQITNTVGVYLDETPASSSGAASSAVAFPLDLGLLDLHHIEVLRGPQGTLYGAGSMGGVLKYVTNVPDVGEFSGMARASLSHTARYGGTGHALAGVLNIPLAEDVAALRIAVLQDKPAGYIRAIGPAGSARANGGDTRGLRLALAVTPARNLTLTATANTQRMHRDGLDQVDYDAGSRQPAFGQYSQQIFEPQPIDKRDDLYSLNVEYKPGSVRLNSITSYGRATLFRQLDATVTSVDFLPFPATTAVDQQFLRTRKFTQEFRATSDRGERWDWLAGLFYTSEKATNDPLGRCYAAPGSCPSLYDIALPSTYRELAAYGDLTFHLKPGLSVTAGIRVARNKQTYSQTSGGFYYEGLEGTVSSASEDTSRTYLLTGQYALNKTSNVYARVATAYRPGGPNAVVPGAALKTTFEPDTSTNYEVGYKADLLEKKLAVQMALFHINWKNIQQFYSLGGASGVLNAGSARVRGLEASLSYRPSAQWVINAAASAIDARLTSDAPGLDAHAGDRLPTSPKFSASASLRYRFELAGRAASAGLSARYAGERLIHFQSPDARYNARLPGYGIVNAEAGIQLGRVELDAYVRNLFGKEGIASGSTANLPFGGTLLYTVEQPRTIGLTATYRF